MKTKKWLWLALVSSVAVMQAQELPVKGDLGENRLAEPLVITSSSVQASPYSVIKGGAFAPSPVTGYTVEMKGKLASTGINNGSMVFRVNAADAQGGFYSIYPSKVEDYEKNRLAAYLNSDAWHIYRMAVKGLDVYYYCDNVLIAKGTLGQVLNASVQTTLGQELLTYGSFEDCLVPSAPSSDWGSIPEGRMGSGTYSRVDASGGWASNGSKYFFVRMRDGGDSNLSSDVIYTKLNGLAGGKTYQLSLNYKGHKDFPGTILVKIMPDYQDYADDAKALGKIAVMEAETIGNSGATSKVKQLITSFALPEGKNSCYLVFVKNGNANMYIDDLSLKELTITSDVEAELAVGRVVADGSAMEIESVKYDLTGAYAPEDPNVGCVDHVNNLITDPGFDKGMENVDKGFTTQQTIYRASGTAGIVSKDAYCGSNMGWVSGTGTGLIQTTLTGLSTFRKYELRAVVKGAGAHFSVQNGSLSESLSATNEWKEVSIPFRTGGNTTVEAIFDAGTAENAYTDNWQLYDKGASESLTEGNMTTSFVSEKDMMSSILQMLADHMKYAKSIYTTTGNNSQGTPMGYFKANSAGQNNEDGVRTNADYAFICAFLFTHGDGVTLPSGITMEEVKDMAVKSINWAYSTHRSLKLAKCTNNAYWGSADKDAGSTTGGYTWESSMWAESVAYAYWLMKDKLTDQQKQNLKTMICAEANLQISREIPWGYTDDTKAEENGWDTNILACAAALFPDEPNADAWFLKCRQFAMNTYSVNQDKYDNTIRDGKRVRDWYIGTNLWDDYTLQNHAFFHTSYQNIAIQELSESYMAFEAMQKDNSTALRNFPLSETLRHNVQPMFDHVLKYLALADGELAMPNGNDWSMFLYDQLASYSAMACIYRDPDALMLENMAFKYTRARQQTTSDGSWMLNSDIGPRRMGVTGRRIVMTYLYHKYFSTASLQPTTWEEFSERHETTKYFPFVNVIRSNTKDRFTAFSWAASKKSYTGMIGTSSPDKNKIFIPFRKGNLGNFTGYFEVSGKSTDASPLVNNYYGMYPKGYTLNGSLRMNSSSLDQQFTLYSTPGNAVIYLYTLKGAGSGTLTKEGGALMAVSTDPFTKQTRTFYSQEGSFTSDGSALKTFSSDWVNIDDEVGVVAKNDNQMAFGERSLVNSIYTSVLYPSYSTENKSFVSGTKVASRNAVYYSNVNKETTSALASKLQVLTLPIGWNGVIAPDPDGTHYLLISNYYGTATTKAVIEGVTCPEGAPVFTQVTDIDQSKSYATFSCTQNYSIANELKVFVQGSGLEAVQADGDPASIYLRNSNAEEVTAVVTILKDEAKVRGNVQIPSGGVVLVGSGTEELAVSPVSDFPGSYRNIAEGKHAYANSQLPGNLPFNTIDSDPATYWQSVLNPADGNEHLTFRLRNQYEIDKVVITPRAGFAPKEVEIQVSNTDGSFVRRATATLSNSDEPQAISITSGKARFVRIKILSGYASQCAIREVEIMGAPTTTN